MSSILITSAPMSARCSVAIAPGSRRVRSRTRTPARGLARKLLDRFRERPAQHPALDGGDRLRLSAEIAVRRERLAGVGFRGLAAAHADERKPPAETFGVAVRAGAAAVVDVMDEKQRSLDPAEIVAEQTDAVPSGVENRGREDHAVHRVAERAARIGGGQ